MTSSPKFRVTPTSVLAAAAFCFFLFAAGRAVVNGVVWLSDKLSPEQLVCAEETRDLGTVRRGERPQAEFVLKNLGRVPTRIGKALPGCSSCVQVVDYTQDEIQPGGSAAVKLALLTEGMEGAVKKAAVVKYGRNNGKYILLYLKANVVVPAAKTEPAGSDRSGENEQETPPKIPEETPGSKN